jgi:hypothetical protein
VLCSPAPVGSVPSLSLEPEFRRSHGSLYKALAYGDVDQASLRQLLVAHRPKTWPLIFAGDASTWDRCDAECSPERGFHHSASKHSAGQSIVAGWPFSWISQLNWAPDSWTAPLDTRRITPALDAGSATPDQVQRLVGLLPVDREVPLFVFDAGHDGVALGHGLADPRAEVLVRMASTRVFHPHPHPHPHPHRDGTDGRPQCHRPRFVLSDAKTWPVSDAELTTSVRRYGNVTVTTWHNLHPKLHGRGRWKDFDELPIIKGSVIRVEVEHLPKPTARIEKTLWLWWSRTGKPDLDLCWRSYLGRFGLEPGTHLPLRQGNARLDDTVDLHTRTGRPLDMAGGRRPQAAPPRPPTRRRPPAAVGVQNRPEEAGPGASSTGVSAPGCNPRHTRSSTEILDSRSRASQGDQDIPKNPLPLSQKGCLTVPSRYDRKLRCREPVGAA